MLVTVCRPSELGAPETATWHAWQAARQLDNPFLAPEFAVAVGEVYSSARVAVVEDAGELVAFLPCTARPLRVASGIAGRLTNIQALICAPGAEVPLADVVRSAGLCMFTFHALAAPAPERVDSRLRRVDALAIDLSGGFDAYLDAARRDGGRFVKEIARKRRRLEREHGGEVRYEFARRDPAAVATLLRWKSSQYRRTGRSDAFGRADVQELVERLVEISTPALTGCVSTLRVDGRLAAADVSLRSTSTLAGWITAFDTDFARCSPGAVGILSLIEAAAAAGVRTIDLATGDEEFKLRLANRAIPLLGGWVGRAALGTAVHRAAHAPEEGAVRFVLAHPQLRGLTRSALRHYGTVRSHIRATTSGGTP